MRVSVIVCSRNRAQSLARALASMSRATRPPDAWEVLIVDNGSTDETPAVVAGFEGSLPVRRVLEPEPGLSRARNRGVSAAKGEYLVWTDDDVTVDPAWLSAYLDAFAAAPGAALFAGQVHPVLESPVTPWFAAGAEHLQGLMAARAFSDVSPLSPHLLPYGANFAVRAAEQRQNLYDPRLGVAPGRRIGGEETDVARAILSAGATGLTVPASIVNHMIPTSRQTLRYVREYFVANGESWPAATPEIRKRLIGGVPPWILRKLIAHKAAYLAKRVAGRDWLPDFVQYAELIGTCRRWRAFRRERRTS
jgi:glycosyltransferase involved in cell wall biosynthesis